MKELKEILTCQGERNAHPSCEELTEIGAIWLRLWRGYSQVNRFLCRISSEISTQVTIY